MDVELGQAEPDQNNTNPRAPPQCTFFLMSLWSLLDGIWGILKGSWGVLAPGDVSWTIGLCQGHEALLAPFGDRAS